MARQILLVDDEAMIRMILADVLGSMDYAVVEAASGDAALRHLDALDDYALVITDIHMPGGIDGLELADRLESRSPGKPLIFMTGRPDVMQRELRRNEAFLRKPFGAEQLLRAVDDLLGRPAAAAAG
ncbi:response regulator [Coralloluteibacterium stylophorae]|uniref:Response regulator n=1 Tax=Coralloluteibacterium stylophorae TaxID=1776034 RepID=A0A8J8AXZ0_9GAMM|nr:response regulator [Coralloluteibacterium stylophorae]MBS7456487.1 response regulator [Coralloluteibacterium stylophorae]